MKRLLFYIIAVTSVAIASTTLSYGKNVNMIMQINNPMMFIGQDEVYIDDSGTMPIIIKGRTFVPIRAVVENLGGSIDWNSEEKVITINNHITNIILQIDNRVAKVDGKEVLLDAAPTIINGRTMLPLRFVSESLGANVEWNSNTKQIFIDYSALDDIQIDPSEPTTEVITID